MMPEMDGFQLVAELQKHPAWRRIPVIVITARDLTAEDHMRLNSGIKTVLMKESFSPASLIEFCAPTGCARLWGDYALDWRERGIQITLLTHGLSQRQLLTIARSMTVVRA